MFIIFLYLWPDNSYIYFLTYATNISQQKINLRKFVNLNEEFNNNNYYNTDLQNVTFFTRSGKEE